MSDADCTPCHEPRSVAGSFLMFWLFLLVSGTAEAIEVDHIKYCPRREKQPPNWRGQGRVIRGNFGVPVISLVWLKLES